MRPRSPLLLRHGPLSFCVMPLGGCPDLGRLAAAVPAAAPFVWFDSARQHAVTGRWSMAGAFPWLTLTTRGEQAELRTSAATHRWREHPLDALRAVWRRYHAPSGAVPYARALGLMGYLSYDLNRWIERLPAPQASGPTPPEMTWYAMRLVVLADHQEQRAWLLSVLDPHIDAPLARRQAQDLLAHAVAWLSDDEAPVDPAGALDPAAQDAWPVTPSITQEAFEGMVSRVLEHIRAGDIFQANVAQRFTAPWPGEALPLYRALRRINPSPFACFLSSPELAVVSCSPERLVRVQDGRIDTRPIAGTRPRGVTREDEAVNSLELLMSEKERAEHIMLVDLARNDLGRVSASGTVGVNELMALETYSHVVHIVSDVAGRLRPGTDPVDVIRAVFPGGTITGCPKVRCMEILREIEPVARGLYTGSLGYLGFDGTMDLNIAIRTIVLQEQRAAFHVGAGIVADSLPEREYVETMHKGAALVAALGEAAANSAVERHVPR